MLEISTWVFIVIVQLAIAASIAVIVLYAKLRKYQYDARPGISENEAEIARTKIRLQSANKLKDMYFSLKAKYTALVKAQNEFEDKISKLIHRDEQAKFADMFALLQKEKALVAQELASIEKSLLSIAISKDDDEKAAERKVKLVQETAEHIDHSVGKIQSVINQQNILLGNLTPLINKLPDEMEAKQELLAKIATLQKTVAEMDTTMKSVCEQNQILQNQVETILGEQELAMRDMRKQVQELSKELQEQHQAYDELKAKYKKAEAEFQNLHANLPPNKAG